MDDPGNKIEIKPPTDSAADVHHPEHARWVKATLVEDECKRLHEAGVMPPVREIEDEVNGTLERLYARERDGETERRKWQKRQTESKESAAKRLSDDLGYHFRKSEDFDRKVERYGCKRGCGGTCRRCKLETRIRMLVATDGGTKEKRGFMFPRWGPQIVNLYGNCVGKRGPFAGRSQAEINRILTRKLERFADESNALLGGWQ